jgi:hypothetical protein
VLRAHHDRVELLASVPEEGAMSTFVQRVGADELASRPRLPWRVDAVTTLLSTWLLVGVVVDAWAHNNLAALETFFTPWHALFYSGFLATAGWILAIAARTRTAGRPGLAAFPAGYGLAVVGVMVFAVGGVGDLLWHTIFGIEQDVQALFSPTHLLLFAGMALMLSTPLRAAWTDPAGDTAPGYRRFLPVVASAALTTVLVAGSFMYWAAFTQTVGADFLDQYNEHALLDGVASVLATNLILLAPLLLLARRWRLPFGTATTIYGGVGVLIGAVDAFDHPAMLVAAVVAGLVVDGLLHLLRPSPARPRRFWAAGALVPLATWSVYFAAVARTAGIGWSAELWTGTIAWACLLGLVLSILMLPPPIPGATSR